MPKVENNFIRDLIEGINTLGSSSPEDVFYPNFTGFLYTVDKTNIYSQSNFSIKGEFGEPVGAILDTHTGKTSLTNSRNAYQSTLARMPVMGGKPLTGVRNMLSYSNRLDVFPWVLTGNNVSVVPSTSHTMNENQIYRMTTSGTSIPVLRQVINDRIIESKGKQCTFSIYINRSSATGQFRNDLVINLNNIGPQDYSVFVNLNAFTCGNILGDADTRFHHIDSEWVRICITCNPYSEIIGGEVSITTSTSVSANSLIELSCPQLEMASDMTKYQDTRNDIYVNDNKSTIYEFIEFDLIDDALITNTSDLIGQSGTLFICGVKKSQIIPYTIETNTFTMGPDTFTGGPANILQEIGGIVGWGFVNKRLSQKEIENILFYYSRRGGSMDYSIENAHEVKEIIDGMTNVNGHVFWNDPRHWYTNVGGTNRLTQPGQSIMHWKSLNGDYSFLQSNLAFAPKAAKVPVGSVRRNLLVDSTISTNFALSNNGGGSLPIVDDMIYNIEDDFYPVSRILMVSPPGIPSNSWMRLSNANTNSSLVYGQTYTLSFYAKLEKGEPVSSFRMRDVNVSSIRHFTLNDETWTLCQITYTAGAGNFIHIGTNGQDSNTSPRIRFLMTKLQFEKGELVTPTQKVVSPFEIYEKGKESKWFARFDGINDFMESSGSYFSGNARTAIIVGARTIDNGQLNGNLIFMGNTNNHYSLITPNVSNDMYSVRVTKDGVAARVDASSGGYVGDNLFIISTRIDPVFQTYLKINRNLITRRSLPFTLTSFNIDKVYLGSAGPHMVGYFSGEVGPVVIAGHGSSFVGDTALDNIENVINVNLKV